MYFHLVRKAAAREAGELRREKQKGEKSREISPHVGREGHSPTLVDRQTPSTSKELKTPKGVFFWLSKRLSTF